MEESAAQRISLFKNIFYFAALITLTAVTGCDNPFWDKNQTPSVNIIVKKSSAETDEKISATAIGTDPDGRVVRGYFGKKDSLEAFEGSSVTKTFTFQKPGNYNLKAYVTDDEGKDSPIVHSDTIRITQGNRAPTITFTSDTYSLKEGETVTLSWDAKDADNNLKGVTFNGKLYQEAHKDTTISGLIQGNYNYTAQAIDDEGLMSDKKKLTINVNEKDNIPPSVSLSINPETGTSSDEYELTIQGNDEDGTVDTTYYQVNDKDWVKTPGANITTKITLRRGENTVQAYVKDNKGAKRHHQREIYEAKTARSEVCSYRYNNGIRWRLGLDQAAERNENNSLFRR